MYVSARQRFSLLFLAIVALSFPVLADDVTISGSVNFSAIDGSSLDHDGASDGTFTVDDGNLTILGTINCLDTGGGANSACPMSFAVSGDFTMAPGSAIYAENRTGGGSGANITLTVGGNVSLQSSGPSFTNGAVISSGNDGNGAAGDITFTVGGATAFAAGTVVSAASSGGQGGDILVNGEGSISASGLVASGPTRNLAGTRLSGAVVNGGSSNAAGGTITLSSTSNSEPAVTIGSSATIVSQGENGGSGLVLIEGCGIEVGGLVASVAKNGSTSAVTVRSGTTLHVSSTGMVRADSLANSASAYKVYLLAAQNIQIDGAASPYYSVNSNPSGNNNTGGSIVVVSTESTVTATGNAFRAGSTANNANGGSISISAANDVNLNGAAINATGGNNGSGGSIAARSYSGGVTWQVGVGDARPTGSAIAAAKRGTIALTYCTTVSTTGSSFPTNGSPVGAYPTTTNACSPSAPSLPAGETLPECNEPPVAVNDAYGVAEGGTLTVPAPGVLGNDTDPDGNPITAILVSGPAHASSFALNADGSFSYVHNGGETTTDSFTYKANDGSLDSNVATVTITITPVNDAPVANNDTYSVNEGGTINFAAPGVLANDTDPDGPALSAILVTGPAHASVFSLNTDGSFVYIHDGSETTSDSFTYQASDGTLLSNIATASITIAPVNDAPVANNDGAYAVAEGATFTLATPGVLGNDTDAEGDSLTAVLVSGPSHASSFTLNADGSFSYTHNGGETTSDSFTYKANDGSLDSNVATVTITITPVNDAPVANNDGSYAVAEGGTFTLATPGVLANDTDPENDSLTAILVSGPAHASSFVLNADGSFSYTHDGSETTSDSFTYKANDGSLDSNVATVMITITPVNDAPVAVNDGPYGVNEGGTLTVNAPGVLGNDTDAEGSPLSAVLVSGPGNASSFTLNADGSFTYIHNGGETTSDSFTYMANDGSLDSNVATVTITITGINDGPVAVADGPYTVAEGGTFTLPAPGVLANDTDAENDTLSAILVSGPANASSFALNADGSFSYTHNGSETTSDSFTYKANDGALDSNTVTVTITITPVNDAPVAVNDGPYGVAEGGTLTVNAPGVLGNDTDAENDSLNAVLVTGPANASSFTLNADGSFTYVHNGSETLADSFTYMANDGSANSNIATVTITITPVNDAPVANNDGPYPVAFHGTINVAAPGVLGNDTDAENNGLTAVLVSGTTQGNLVLNADGSFQYTHTGPSLGADSFTYYAQDTFGAQSAPATVTIHILNSPPTPADDSFLGIGNTELRVGTGSALHPAAVVSGSVLANDTDPDGNPLSVTAFDATSTGGGSVTMLPNGSFNYLPAVGFTGSDSFTYTVHDGFTTASATVTISVTERVWYVNPATAGPQTGRSPEPFSTIGQAQLASAVNDYIHVAQGAQATGIQLKDGQRLVGSGVALVIGPYTLAPATVRPTLGNTVILADGNLVTGLNVTPIAAGITGTNVVSGTITEVGITGGNDGLTLTNAIGTFTLTNVNVAPGGAGVTLNGGSANIIANDVNVTTAGSIGFFGNGTGTVTFNGGSVSTTNATAVDLSTHALAGSGLISVSATNAVNGISLTNTTGMFSVVGTGVAGSGGTITGMSGRGVNATNVTGVTLKSMTVSNSGLQGVLLFNTIAAASALDVRTSSFTGTFGNAIQASSNGSGLLTVTADANTFTSINAAVVAQATSTGGAIVKITNNAATLSTSAPYVVTRNSPGSGAVEATITNNTFGTAGVPGSGCTTFCNGIQALGMGSNTFKVLISGNTIRQINGTAILVRGSEGSTALSATIDNNLIEQPVGTPSTGILVQAGSISTDTNSVCAHIINNTVTGWTTHIFVFKRFVATVFSIPGYGGSGTDNLAVANFIKAQNTVTTVTATRLPTVGNSFSGGPVCVVPAP